MPKTQPTVFHDVGNIFHYILTSIYCKKGKPDQPSLDHKVAVILMSTKMESRIHKKGDKLERDDSIKNGKY